MRVLIMHASAGAGHKRAAEALEVAFCRTQPQVEVCVRDILDFTPTLFRQTYAKGYLRLVRSAPELWGYMYAVSDRKASIPWRRKVRQVFNQINSRSALEFVEDYAPDVIICTHFLPLEVLTSRRRRKRSSRPLFCVVTDYAVHSLWIMDGVSGYFVASDEARRHLMRRGQPEGRIEVTGIPIHPDFARPVPAAEARRQLGVDAALPTVLILSGGMGVGPTAGLVRAFGAAQFPGQLLVVAGANEALREEVAAAAAPLAMPVRVEGFITNMHDFMSAADIVISKPGGLSCSEVTAKGVPLMIIDPIPGQEQRNCEYLLERGAAVRVFDVEDAPYKVRQILETSGRMEALRRGAALVGMPQAAARVVASVLARI